MKTKVCLSLLFLCTTYFVSAEEPKQKFAEKNTIELGGEVSFFHNIDSVTGDNTRLIVSPIISWYVAKSLHLGGSTGLQYFYSNKWYISGPDFSLTPTLYIGYTIPINEKLFFDLSIFSGFYVSIYDSNPFRKTGFTQDYLWGLTPSLKVDMGGGLIAFGLIYKHDDNNGFMRTAIGSTISYSIYF